jgi:hypothetical protein
MFAALFISACALHGSARQVAFFWDVYVQAYVMIGNCCIWLVAVALMRPFNSECASSHAKFMCFFRNGISLFSFLLTVKLQQDVDNGVQADDFIWSINIALLVLMSCCLLLDLWPLTEVAEGAGNFLKKHRAKRKTKKEKKKTQHNQDEALPARPTPPSGPSSRPTTTGGLLHTHLVEPEANEFEVVTLSIDLVPNDHDGPSPSRNNVSDRTELAVGAVPGDLTPSYLPRKSSLSQPAAASTVEAVISKDMTELSPQAHTSDRSVFWLDVSDELCCNLNLTGKEGVLWV